MQQKQLFRFLLVVGIASLFHITALIFIVGYVYENYLHNGSWLQVMVLFGLAVAAGIVVQMPQLYLWAVPDRYAPYFTNPAYTGGQWLLNSNT